MLQWLENAPYAVTFTVFFCGAMVRANTTYWIGRGLAAGVSRSRFQKLLQGPLYRKAQLLLARWGVLAVPLSFMTVGIQSAVNASAGATRMPLRRYIPAVIVGCLIWALIYTTVGMTVIYAWIALDWPWLVLGAAVIGLAIALYVRWRRRAARVPGPEQVH